jgi:hypothetical protein
MSPTVTASDDGKPVWLQASQLLSVHQRQPDVGGLEAASDQVPHLRADILQAIGVGQLLSGSQRQLGAFQRHVGLPGHDAEPQVRAAGFGQIGQIGQLQGGPRSRPGIDCAQ